MWNRVISALLPVLFMILLGTGLRYKQFLPASFFKGLNKLSFWVGLPCMLFTSISRATIVGGDVLWVILTIVLASCVMIPFAFCIGKVLGFPSPSLRVLIQGGFRGNLAFVGLPVVMYALPTGSDLQVIALLAMAPTIPFYNIVSVCILLKPGEGDLKARVWQALAQMSKNPLIISCTLGLLALWADFQLPEALNRSVEGVGRIGLPAALIALGAELSLEKLKASAIPTLVGSLLKVAVLPLIGWGIATLLGVHGELLTICLVYLATPAAAASFIMADQMGADSELAASIIVMSVILAFPALGLILIFA